MSFQPFALFDYINIYSDYGKEESFFDAYGGFGGFLGWFLLNLLITFFVYCIPLIGYIHITAKELTLKSARKLCLIYSAVVFVVLSAVYALLEQNISANAGAAVIWGYYVNMAIIKRVYLKPRTRPTTQRPSSVVSSSTATNEAEHWKKQYFDLYNRTQQSNQASSLFDGLSDQEIEQVRQYAEFLKKSNPRSSPAAPSNKPSGSSSTAATNTPSGSSSTTAANTPSGSSSTQPTDQVKSSSPVFQLSKKEKQSMIIGIVFLVFVFIAIIIVAVVLG